MRVRKKLMAAVATLALCAGINGTAYAQSHGVAGDGTNRLLWKGTDGRVSLWKLDANLNYATSKEYGPYTYWHPIGITVARNNTTYLTWKYYDGSVSIWALDTNLNLINSHVYGPYAGWTPKDLSVETTTTNTSGFRLHWKYYDGTETVWQLDQNLNYVTSKPYGPYFGYYIGNAD
jgi:hypothetical protein